MLRQWWRMLRTMAVVVGVALSFFAVIEVIRAYQTLAELHPAAGVAFLAILAVAIGWLAVYLTVNLWSRPMVLRPPAVVDRTRATDRELGRYGRYLCRYIERLERNPVLAADDRALAAKGRLDLEGALEGPAVPAAIARAEDEVIRPLLAVLDEEAARQTRASTRDVMLWVTLSPYKAGDLGIVIYRNLMMTIRIIRIYNSRPRLKEQLRILADTLNVVATVNFLNMGKSLLESLGSKVPVMGKFVDDIAQGIGAGFMTSVVGHTAMARCRAFRGWSELEAKDTLRRRAVVFYSDVTDIFLKDIWPTIGVRAGATAKEVRDRLVAVLEATGSAVGMFFRSPKPAAEGVLAAPLPQEPLQEETEQPGVGRRTMNAGLQMVRGVGSAGGKVVKGSRDATLAVGRFFVPGKRDQDGGESGENDNPKKV